MYGASFSFSSLNISGSNADMELGGILKSLDNVSKESPVARYLNVTSSFSDNGSASRIEVSARCKFGFNIPDNSLKLSSFIRRNVLYPRGSSVASSLIEVVEAPRFLLRSIQFRVHSFPFLDFILRVSSFSRARSNSKR